MAENLQDLSEAENEFMQEGRGEGSLSLFVAQDTANFFKTAMREGEMYVGYDVHPENIEALYFEGMNVPRWESIEADSVAEQEEIYRELYVKAMTAYPLISRVNDTDQRVGYTPEEVSHLQAECEQVLSQTDNPKAIKAAQKFLIACHKATGSGMGLMFIPS